MGNMFSELIDKLPCFINIALLSVAFFGIIISFRDRNQYSAVLWKSQ